MKQSKKLMMVALMALIAASSNSCAFLFDGAKPDSQTDIEKYTKGDNRDVMWGYVAMDVLYGGLIPGLIGLIIDYSTGAIYEINEQK